MLGPTFGSLGFNFCRIFLSLNRWLQSVSPASDDRPETAAIDNTGDETLLIDVHR